MVCILLAQFTRFNINKKHLMSLWFQDIFAIYIIAIYYNIAMAILKNAHLIAQIWSRSLAISNSFYIIISNDY